MGGLGNQMFQYAFGRRIAEETGTEVKFDLASGFKHDPYRRRFALGALNVNAVGAEPSEIPAGMSWPYHPAAKAAWSLMPAPWRRVVGETAPFRFDASKVADNNPKAYYFGYWQNERYFLPIQDVVRREFTLRAGFCESLAALSEEIAGCRAVSLHVRRYLDIGANGHVICKTEDLYGVCGVEYFNRALDVIGREPGTVCYVFSDNPHWAKANLKLPVPCRYVAELHGGSDAEELVLMASCQHHIISNSSFSWWGAWLGRNPKKVVVAPRIWKRSVPEASVDIQPKAWIRL
jgi:hypothetical protein